MKSRVGLGLSSIGASESRSSPWERVGKIALLVVVCALLAGFFAYLTGQVQIGTASATNPDAAWKPSSRSLRALGMAQRRDPRNYTSRRGDGACAPDSSMRSNGSVPRAL
jgi:hypothetical protein